MQLPNIAIKDVSIWQRDILSRISACNSRNENKGEETNFWDSV